MYGVCMLLELIIAGKSFQDYITLQVGYNNRFLKLYKIVNV